MKVKKTPIVLSTYVSESDILGPIDYFTVGDLSRLGNQGIPHFTFPIGKKTVKIFPVREIKW